MRLTEARAVPAEQWLRRLRETYGQDEPGGDLLRRIQSDRLTVTRSLHIMPSVPRRYRGNGHTRSSRPARRDAHGITSRGT